MTKPELIAEAKATLGFPTVKLELHESQFDFAWIDTCRWFTARKGIGYEYAYYVNGTNEIPVPDEVLSVLNVYVEMDYASIAIDVDLNDIAWNIVMQQSTYKLGTSMFVMNHQRWEDLKRFYSQDPDWETFRGRDGKIKIRLFPIDKDQYRIIYIGLVGLSEANMTHVEKYDEDLIFRYFTAKLKYMLGRARGKYASLPAGQGDVTMDGDSLIQEAKEELEALEIEIRNSSDPMLWLSEG